MDLTGTGNKRLDPEACGEVRGQLWGWKVPRLGGHGGLVQEKAREASTGTGGNERPVLDR
ncbi:Hypothetical predicted protein, partial [Pelobates cultripes]